MRWWLMYDELKTMGKEVVVAYLKVLSRYSPEGTEESRYKTELR
jgi:hypothetical protein